MDSMINFKIIANRYCQLVLKYLLTITIIIWKKLPPPTFNYWAQSNEMLN